MTRLELYTKRDIAKKLGVSEKTVYNRMLKGKINYVIQKKRRLYIYEGKA